MEFTIGETVEAVDQFGVWTTARIIEKRDDSVVVTFPQWKSEWDREISDASEVRKKTMEEVLIPRHLANNKVNGSILNSRFSILIVFQSRFSVLVHSCCVRDLF